MKKSKLFITLWLVLIIGFSTITTVYLNHYEVKVDEQAITQAIAHEMKYVVMSKIISNSPDHDPLIFQEGVDEVVKEAIREEFQKFIIERSWRIDDTNGINYVITLEPEGKPLTKGNVDNGQDVYVEVLISRNELINNQTDFLFDTEEFINASSYYIDNIEDGKFADNPRYWRQNVSKLFEITYPDDINVIYSYNASEVIGNYNQSLYSNENEIANIIGVILVGTSLVIVAFIWVARYDNEITAPFLNLVERSKIETLVILLAAVIMGLSVSLFFGHLARIMNHLNDLPEILQLQKPQVLLVYNIILWVFNCAFLIAVSMCALIVKSFLKNGVIKTIKERTYIGSFLLSIRNLVNNLNDVLSSNKDRKLILTVIINATILMVLYSVGSVGVLLALIYTIFVLRYILREYQNIRNDYQHLSRNIKAISNGDFNFPVNDSYGVFDELSKDLYKIKDGFEQAVNEEVKTQNTKNELVTNISHDLKTPITALQNYAKLLEDPNLEVQKRQDYVDKVGEYTKRLSQMIEGIFEISKLNSGVVELNRIKLDLVQMVKHALFEYDEDFRDKNIQLISQFPDQNVEAFLDSEKTYRIFSNIINNISKYAMPGTRAYVEIIDANIEYQVTFKNISKVAMNFTKEEIVERFVRGDKSRSETGSGVGLAIVKNLTEVQGGEIHIDIDGDLFKIQCIFPKEV